MKTLKSLFFCSTLLFAQNTLANLMVFNNANELDFNGNFDYALNFHGSGSQQVGDAIFINVEENGSGLPVGAQISGFDRDFNWGGGSNLGVNVDDNSLESILTSLIWGQFENLGNIDLDVNIGTRYRLQLLYSEGFTGNRNYNVSAEGLLDEDIVGVSLDPSSLWQVSATQGYAMTLDFVATDDILNIDMSRLQGGDTNYHISGLTLERVPSPQSVGLLGIGFLILLIRKYGRKNA